MLPRAARGASIRRAAPRPVHTVPEQTRKWHPGHRRRRAAKQAAENVRKTTENDAGNTRHVRIFVLYMPEIPDAGARIGRRSSGPRAASASPPRPPTAYGGRTRPHASGLPDVRSGNPGERVRLVVPCAEPNASTGFAGGEESKRTNRIRPVAIRRGRHLPPHRRAEALRPPVRQNIRPSMYHCRKNDR